MASRGIRAGRAFVELGTDDKITAGLRRAQQQLRSFAAGVRTMGLDLLKVSTAIGLPVAAATRTFATFEQSMARVKAITGASEEEFGKLTAMARKLGAETVFTASQAAEAMGFFALAGFKVNQILEASVPTLALAAAGQLQIAESADIVAKIMAGMGIEADDLTNAVDVLTKAFTTANTDLIQLGHAMKFIGPVAKSAGISFEETVAAVQLLSNAGIQGEMAGTTLRGAILSLTDPSEKAIGIMRKLGVATIDASGNFRPLNAIVDDFNQALQGLGTGQRLSIVGGVFDARQAAGFAELLSQGGERLREFTAALGQASGTAKRIESIQLDTLIGDFKILRSAAEDAQIALGKTLSKSFRTIATALTKVVNAVSEWIQTNPRLIQQGVLVSALIGALGVGLLGLSLSITIVAKAMTPLIFAFKSVGVVLKLGVALFGALLTPMGAVVAALAVAGAATQDYSAISAKALKWIGEKFDELRRHVNEVLSAIVDSLTAGDIQSAGAVLWAGLKVVWQQGSFALQKIVIEMKRAIHNLLATLGFSMLATMEETFFAIQRGWIIATSHISRRMTGLVSEMKMGWAEIQFFATQTWNSIKGLFDEGFDVTIAQGKAGQEFLNATEQIENQRNRDLQSLAKRKVSQHQEAKSVHDASMAVIGQTFEDAIEQLNRTSGDQVAAAKSELNKANLDLKAAIDEAKRAREERTKGPDLSGANAVRQEKGPHGQTGEAAADGLRGVLDQFNEAIAGAGAALGDKISVSGTFDASVAGLLGSSGVDEQQLAEQRQANKHLAKLARKADAGGLVFA